MEVRVGSDILKIEKFQKSFERSREKFERDIFWESELKNRDTSHIAGIFCAKEAVIKALDLKAGSWKQIEIGNSPSGKPFVKFHQSFSSSSSSSLNPQTIESSDLSISHHGDYVMAVAVFLLK